MTTLDDKLRDIAWPGIDTSALTDNYERDWTDSRDDRILDALIEFVQSLDLQDQCIAFVEALAADARTHYDTRRLAEKAAHAALKTTCITTLPCYCTDKCWLTTDDPEAQRRRDAIASGRIVYP